MKSILTFVFILVSIAVFAQDNVKGKSNPQKSDIKPAGVKLFGDIYFGMSKAEVRKIISQDKERQTFSVSGYKLSTMASMNTYNENGLCILFLTTMAAPNETMSENSCRNTLIAIDSIMINMGAKNTFKNKAWPEPLAVDGNTAASYEHNGKSIDISTTSGILPEGYYFYMWMMITTTGYNEKANKQSANELKKDINEAKEKF